MASIGPTLPPHLAKRKRTPDDETSTDSPPTKIRASESAQSNNGEIDLESDSDDGYGPSAPVPTTRPSIGPSLPPSIGPTAPLAASAGPSLPRKNADEVALDSEDEDDMGPTPPEPKRTHGPAPPPAALSERPPASADSDSDSDDNYGPALPSSTSHQQRQARALEAAEAEAAANKAPKRDEWMLAPPSAGEHRAADPTKLKARRFNSGPRANASGGGEISSIWTETPQEKRKRLENAVLGRDPGAGPTPTSKSARPKPATKEDAEQATLIQSFTEATRGRSLYEEHQTARAQGPSGSSRSAGGKKSWVDEEEDDPSKRAFDKEKDMKLGGRIGASQRRELLNKAANFGGRFDKGKYL
ncbi:hypothetical protein F4782DRAFT_499694 [Xylaria castorea]|nr:hypothetical protein F4782DRAFT_499694 [Xylaria castorea]